MNYYKWIWVFKNLSAFARCLQIFKTKSSLQQTLNSPPLLPLLSLPLQHPTCLITLMPFHSFMCHVTFWIRIHPIWTFRNSTHTHTHSHSLTAWITINLLYGTNRPVHSSIFLILFSTEESHSCRFGTTWVWVKDHRIVIFGWTAPLRLELRP